MSASDGEKPMDQATSASQPATPCCAGDSSQHCAGTDAASGCGCGCGTEPAPLSRVKLLISMLVILGALGVGAYSLARSGPSQQAAAVAPGGTAKAPAAAVVPTSLPLGAAPSPCCGAAPGAEASPQPTCCGGGGGGAAALPAEPTCGDARKGCCGR